MNVVLKIYQTFHYGSFFIYSLYPNDKPNVALLNIGSEELKGNETIKETYQLLNEKKSDNYNFAGYIEGNHLWMERLM